MNVVYGTLTIESGSAMGVDRNHGRIASNATQSISDVTLTELVMQQQLYDNGNITDTANNRLIANSAGVYLIVGHCSWLSDGGAGTYRRLTIQKYNSADAEQEFVTYSYPAYNSNIYGSIVHIFRADAGDYFKLFFMQDRGSSLTVGSATSTSHLASAFEMSKISG